MDYLFAHLEQYHAPLYITINQYHQEKLYNATIRTDKKELMEPLETFSRNWARPSEHSIGFDNLSYEGIKRLQDFICKTLNTTMVMYTKEIKCDVNISCWIFVFVKFTPAALLIDSKVKRMRTAEL